MNLKPILDRIVVRPADPDKKTAGGIIIANPENEGVTKGEIVAVGAGAHDEKGKFVEPSVSVGDKIAFNLGVGEKIEHDDVEYVVITEKDIIVIFS